MIYARITLLFLACGLLSACRKNDNGGSFTYKGRWLEDCSGTPVANKTLKAEMYIYGFNKKDRYDATCITDSLGNFSLALPNHGSSVDLRFITEAYIPVNNTEGGNGNVYDLGTVYSRCNINAVLRVHFNSPHADTFYIGGSFGSTYGSIYPASGTGILSISIVNQTSMIYNSEQHSYHYDTRLNYLYGFGWQQYHDAFKTNGGPKLIHMENVFSICSPPDTVDLTVP
jgi:hypothetical protein